MGVGGFGGRWLCLSAAILATFAGTGVGYAWGVFSPTLKAKLGLSQSQLMIVANAPTYAVSLPPMAFVPGWVYDAGGDRRGAVISMLLAALGLGGGYLLMYATAEHLLPIPHTPGWSVSMLFIGNVAAGWGASFSCVATMVVIVKNFPHRRGTIVGLVKCITGLSGGMYAQLYSGFLAPNALNFVLMAAVCNLLLNSGTAFFLPVVAPDRNERHLDTRLRLAMALVILLTAGILAAAIAAHFFPEDAGAGSASGSDAGDAGGRDRAKDFAVGLIVVFCAVLCVPALGGDCRPECSDESVRNRVQEALRREGKAWRANRRTDTEEPLLDEKPEEQEVEDRNPCQALATLDCWLLMWADAWAQGAGMMMS